MRARIMGRVELVLPSLMMVFLLGGCQGNGTFLHLSLQSRGGLGDVARIGLQLGLADGRSATSSLAEPGGASVHFPTDATFQITRGSGALTVTATAFDAHGGKLGSAGGMVTLQSGKTAQLTLTLAATITGVDGGADLLPAPPLPDLALTSDDLSRGPDLALPQTVPGAPVGVSAAGGNASATVSWNAPASDGNSAITGYTVTTSPGNFTMSVGGTARMATFSGLNNGTSYTFSVTATNAIGTGPAATSNAVTPTATPMVPDAPGNVMASANVVKGATVTWSAPDNHGSAITMYTVTSSPGNVSTNVSGNMLTATITGLGATTVYSFTVTATNGIGLSPASAPSNSITAADVPGAPTMVAAVAQAGGQASVSWMAPSTNGSAISGYTITTTPATTTQMTSGSPFIFTGLSNGTPYTFTVTATNGVGTGAGGTSGSITAGDVPGTPTSVSATAKAGAKATLTWTAPAANGSAITGYTITSVPATTSQPANGSPYTFTGLTIGTPYSFVVVASNGFGSGAGGSSNSITAGDVPAAPTPVSASNSASGAATVQWTTPAANGSAITGYNISWSGTASGSTTAGANMTSTVVSSLAAGSYTFSVTAGNGLGTGAAASSSATPIAVAPAAPTGVAACPANGNVRVSWSASAGAQSYNVYFQASPGVTTGSTHINIGASPTTIGSLTNGTAYYFKVSAVNAAGFESMLSSEVSATPASAVHDTLFVAADSGLEMWDCFSAIPDGTTGGTRSMTSTAIAQIQGGGLFVDGTNAAIYISDRNNNQVSIWNNATTLSGAHNTPDRYLAGASTQLSFPRGLWVDPAKNRLYVANGVGPLCVWNNATTIGTSTHNLAPDAVATDNVNSNYDQISYAPVNGGELWVAGAFQLRAYKNVDGWSGNVSQNADVIVTVNGITQLYNGAFIDTAKNNVWFALANTNLNVVAVVPNAASASGTITLSAFQDVAPGSAPVYAVAINDTLINVAPNTGGKIEVWSNASTGPSNPTKTVTSGLTLTNPNYVGGIFYVP
jgi:hypothetical protein